MSEAPTLPVADADAAAEAIISREAAMMRAQKLANESIAATAAGDTARVQEIKDRIEADPELKKLIEEHGREHSPTQEIEKMKGEIEEFANLLGRIMTTSREAIERGASTEALFSTDEADVIARMLETLNQSMGSARDQAAAKAMVTELSTWLTNERVATMRSRIRHLYGYFGGEPPESLIIQVRMFDDAVSKLDALKKSVAK